MNDANADPLSKLDELTEWCAENHVKVHFTRQRNGKPKVRVEIGRVDFVGRHGLLETLEGARDFYSREQRRRGED
jgi:hypothetical protein